MDNRADKKAQFLANAGWNDAQCDPIAQDASSRSYARLTKGKDTVILMDAAPKNADNTAGFVQIAKALTGYGLAAPRIFAEDMAHGFLLIEDLGETDFANHLASHPQDTHLLYRSATDVLVALHTHALPELPKMTPAVAGNMVRLTGEQYTKSTHFADDLEHCVSDAIASNCSAPDHLALRDFHVENLIWRSELDGAQRVGLLDFQDAFNAPAGYDLASLVRDVRRDIPEDLKQAMIIHFADQLDLERESFACAVATLSVQRNLRILGVFARLIRSFGKPKYATFLPRTFNLIQRDLEHPALASLKTLCDNGLPHPNDLGFST